MPTIVDPLPSKKSSTGGKGCYEYWCISKMKRPSSMGSKVRSFFQLQWVSDTGRIVIRTLTFGAVHLPRTDRATVVAGFKSRKGFLARFMVRRSLAGNRQHLFYSRVLVLDGILVSRRADLRCFLRANHAHPSMAMRG